jgi:hypothetical protein
MAMDDEENEAYTRHESIRYHDKHFRCRHRHETDFCGDLGGQVDRRAAYAISKQMMKRWGRWAHNRIQIGVFGR